MRAPLLAAASLAASLAVSCPTAARADVDRTSDVRVVDRVELQGGEGVESDTLLALLPRSPPATYTQGELDEYERRLNDLGLFDRVAVHLDGRALIVALRTKFTLTPLVSLSTGRTLKDTFVLLGADEYNAFGRAVEVGGYVSYSERAPNVEAWVFKHAYDPHRVAPFAGVQYFSSSLRFPDGAGWFRRRVGADAGVNLPYAYGTPLRIEVGVSVFDEQIREVETPAPPPSGVYVGEWVELTWDAYTFRDLAPSGFRTRLRLQPGAFVGPAEPRHHAELRHLHAFAFGETTALLVNLTGSAYTSGNANWSALVGSVSGVRGLSDAFYRNTLQAVANVELRQAWRFAERWALQGVLFTDAATFRSMDEFGTPRDWTRAWSFGAGARLIPTFLAGLLLRVDAAYLVAPEETWLVQTALSQYF